MYLGTASGKGLIRYHNGDYYEGETYSDAENGIGKYYWSNGDF